MRLSRASGAAIHFHDTHGGLPASYLWFVYADGSVHFLSKNISRDTYRALATYNAGDRPGPDAP